MADGFSADGGEGLGGFAAGRGADLGTGASGIDVDAETFGWSADEEVLGDRVGHGAAAGVAGADKEEVDLWGVGGTAAGHGSTILGELV